MGSSWLGEVGHWILSQQRALLLMQVWEVVLRRYCIGFTKRMLNTITDLLSISHIFKNVPVEVFASETPLSRRIQKSIPASSHHHNPLGKILNIWISREDAPLTFPATSFPRSFNMSSVCDTTLAPQQTFARVKKLPAHPPPVVGLWHNFKSSSSILACMRFHKLISCNYWHETQGRDRDLSWDWSKVPEHYS